MATTLPIKQYKLVRLCSCKQNKKEDFTAVLRLYDIEARDFVTGYLYIKKENTQHYHFINNLKKGTILDIQSQNCNNIYYPKNQNIKTLKIATSS